ncbi:hypothetical protein KQX54_004910 [Cotesia glomerata]|uniref:Uncharacterized protein n=1 Tax=Cotesia glomerata TaxID=32391 RepID=A0AAV7HX62_COTGL|nr:hypothetical protein KQX54_004910 [Cotesia glomerata]
MNLLSLTQKDPIIQSDRRGITRASSRASPIPQGILRAFRHQVEYQYSKTALLPDGSIERLQRNARCVVAEPTTSSRHREIFSGSTTVSNLSLAPTQIGANLPYRGPSLVPVVVKSIEKCHRDRVRGREIHALDRMRSEPKAGWRVRALKVPARTATARAG